MGLSSAAMMCQRTTDAVVHLFTKEGCDCTNFLDDFDEAEVGLASLSLFRQNSKGSAAHRKTEQCLFHCSINRVLGDYV